MNNNFLLFLAKEMPIDVLVNLVRTTSDEYLAAQSNDQARKTLAIASLLLSIRLSSDAAGITTDELMKSVEKHDAISKLFKEREEAKS